RLARNRLARTRPHARRTPARARGPNYFELKPIGAKRNEPPGAEAAEGPLVGATGFEPATTCTPSKCATRLRYAPRKMKTARVFCTRAAAMSNQTGVPRAKSKGQPLETLGVGVPVPGSRGLPSSSRPLSTF